MESDNQSGGATAAGAGGGGRLLVDESCADVQNDRKRFEIELKHGETTIVSWVKLLKDSGIPVDQSPPSSPEPPKRLHQEDESRSKCSNIILKKEKYEQNYRSPSREHCRPKKQRTAVSEATKIGHARVRSITSTSRISELNNERIELPDLNVPYTVHAAGTLPTHIKDENLDMVDGSMLESTILEMQTIVADSRRLHGDVQDSVATKSRLPQELKQKLETVARIAHSSQGRISDELITRLMTILGHWLKPRTLKRWLRDMVPSEISARGGDTIRFTQIKTEVIEMIKFRNPSKGGLDNETMELHAEHKAKYSMEHEMEDLHADHKAKYSMDHEMEDKICDFYDIYVQGMDEIKSSEIRKFYIQLAALWPKGTMDNHGIRNAICNSKERRRTALQEKGQEKGKGKKPSSAGLGEDLHGKDKLVAALVNDTNAPILTFPDTVVPGTPELNQNLSAPAKRFSPPSAGSCQDLFKQRKFNIFEETT